VGASSSAWVTADSSVPVVAAGSVLLSMIGACGLTTVVDRCVNCDTSSSMVGAGLRLVLAGSPTVS
jgi:hypothetical protein